MSATQIVHRHGFLVDARRNDDWLWSTSVIRDDTGAGAGELIYCVSLRPR